MPWPVHPTGFFGARGDSDTYRIERSLRFNSADSAYLSRTPASAGNRKTWTWSGWVKRGKLGTTQSLFARYTANTGSGLLSLIFWNDDTLRLISGTTDYRISTAKYRDCSAWYHVVCSVDTTQATANNRVRLYVNGSEITSFTTTNNYNQDEDTQINENVAHYIGYYLASVEFDGYLTEINFIDGQALTPSSFGETDAITGRWKAKAFTGSYGTNGFYLKFADNSGTTSTTLGKDSSPNGNNWTPNNFSVTAGADNDSLVDSPTNYGSDSYSTSVDNARGNYCTLNPLRIRSTVTVSEGNLKASKSASSTADPLFGTFGMSSGKWYWEVRPTSVSGYYYVGIEDGTSPNDNNPSSDSVRAYEKDGYKWDGGTSLSYGTSFTSNDVIGVALNMDSGEITFYKNGSSQGLAYSSGISGKTWFPYVLNGGLNNSYTTECNFGQRPFAYTAPSGFKALCTQNLPQPTIQKPSSAMDVVTYTGTGSSQSISSLGFSPDLVWIKGRSGATDHALYDVIRGSQARLESNNTDAEVTSDNGLTSFDSAGFTLGTLAQVNTNTATYVGWSWDAGSTDSTNNSGSITSTVRANPQAGFSIVSYTGNNTSGQTVGHGLGTTPAMIIIKNRPAGNNAWVIWHKSLASTELLIFTTTAKISDSNSWDGGSFTSTTFKVGNSSANYDTNLTTSGGQHIAYCFAEIEGYSKFGSYTGNGSSDGPFVWCGFRPRWVMIKRSDSTSNWELFDTAREPNNVMIKELYPHLSDVENASSSDEFDIISNGFKPRSTTTIHNASGGTYIFAAFAESPFKYARAR